MYKNNNKYWNLNEQHKHLTKVLKPLRNYLNHTMLNNHNENLKNHKQNINETKSKP